MGLHACRGQPEFVLDRPTTGRGRSKVERLPNDQEPFSKHGNRPSWLRGQRCVLCRITFK